MQASEHVSGIANRHTSVAVAGSGVPPPPPPDICRELDELLGPSVLPTGVSGASLGFGGATVVPVGLLGSFG